MGLFDGLKIMGDIISGGIAAAKAGFKLDELVERSLGEYGDKRSETDKKLYEEYIAVKAKYDNEKDSENPGITIDDVEAAQVAYLNSFRKNPAVPEELAAEITLAVADFNKANADGMEKIKQRMLKMCSNEEERQELMKAFEEEG